MRKLWIALSFCVAASGAGADNPATLSDLDRIIEAIESVHPSPWHKVTRDEFMREAARLRAELPELNPEEIAVRQAGLVAALGDGHTYLDLHSPLAHLSWFPIRLARFPDGIAIIAAATEHRDKLGARVVSIFGHDAEAVWKEAEAVVHGDNVYSRMTNAPGYLISPFLMKGLGYGNGTTLEIELSWPDGRSVELEIDAVQSDGGPWFRDPSRKVALEEQHESEGELYYQNLSSPYTTILNGTALYVRIDQLVNASEKVTLLGESREATLAELFSHVFDLIDSGVADRLVVDLRRNGGGNNQLAVPLVDGIVARPSLAQRGKLFVLTEGMTFSAAMNLVSLLESKTAAVFVGAPPGGSPLHFGDARPVTLPSGRQLWVSTLHWDLGVAPWDVRRVMEPDLAAPMTLAALRRGTDPAMEAVRNFSSVSTVADRLLAIHEADGFARAVEAAEELVEDSDPLWSPLSQQLIDFGWGLIRNGASGDEIYGAFSQATELYPHDPNTWYTLGRIYLWPGRWHEAANAFAHAHRLDPANDTIRRMMHLSRLRSHDPDSASPRHH